MSWINIEDGKPEYDMSVLVAFDTVIKQKQYTTAYLANHKVCTHSERRCEQWFVTVSNGHTLGSRTPVTHWMPIPNLTEDK